METLQKTAAELKAGDVVKVGDDKGGSVWRTLASVREPRNYGQILIIVRWQDAPSEEFSMSKRDVFEVQA